MCLEVSDECFSQVAHTAFVLLVAVAISVPMLAAQVALKNWAAAQGLGPNSDIDQLNRTLPDVLLNRWPRNTIFLVDIALSVLALGTLMLIIYAVGHGWIIMRRLLIQLGITNFLRGLVVALTLLPITYDGHCSSSPSTTLVAFVLDTVNIVKNLNVCNAFIFSGHTAYSVLLASVWVIYSSNLIVNLVGIVLALVTIFFVSFNRLHYTVDIVLAVIISLFLLLVHHLLLRIGVLEKVKEDAASSVGGAENGPPTLQKKLETRRSHWLICVLVALVRWIDARHLESSNEEEDSLL